MRINGPNRGAFCGLTEEEVLGEIAIAAFANHPVHQEHGAEKIRDMIVNDIGASQAVRTEAERAGLA